MTPLYKYMQDPSYHYNTILLPLQNASHLRNNKVYCECTMLWLPMYQDFVEVNFQNIEHNDLTNIYWEDKVK